MLAGGDDQSDRICIPMTKVKEGLRGDSGAQPQPSSWHFGCFDGRRGGGRASWLLFLGVDGLEGGPSAPEMFWGGAC